MISKILRATGHGVASVGRAVQAAAQKLDTTFQPPPQAAPAPAEGAPAAPAPAASPGFSLPDIGPAPDMNAPDYQGPEGQKKFATDMETYSHKQDIHKAFTDLDKTFTDAHPSRDFAKEYADEVAMQQQHEKERPQGSGLARAALALGDFNPAVQQSGRSNLDTYNKGVGEAQSQSDKSFAQRMMLKQRMHEQAAADAEASGNWKKALAEKEKSALLKADNDALAFKRAKELEGVKQTGAEERAKIRAEAAKKVADTRAHAIGAAHGLSGSFLQTFEKEAAKAVAQFLGPQNLMKEYTPADMDMLTTYVEHIAEMIHDQQYGQGSSEKYMQTHPGKRGKPTAPAAKEKF